VYQTAGQTILPTELSGLAVTPSAATATEVPPAFDLVATIEAMLREGGPDIHGRGVAIAARGLIARALRHTHGHQAQATELVGINGRMLRHTLRELGIALEKMVTERDAEE